VPGPPERAAAETPIATTTAIPLTALEAVRAAAPRRKTLLGHEKDEFPVALARHGQALELFEHPGPVLATVLAYLRERRGIDLARSRHSEVAAAISRARGSTFLLLGEEQVPLAGSLTDTDGGEELVGFFDALHGGSEGPGVGEAMRDGIRFLRRALEAITPGSVVLVAIL
jgi:hypothetical protein